MQFYFLCSVLKTENAAFFLWGAISRSCHHTLPLVYSLTLHGLFLILGNKFLVLDQPPGMLKIAMSVSFTKGKRVTCVWFSSPCFQCEKESSTTLHTLK